MNELLLQGYTSARDNVDASDTAAFDTKQCLNCDKSIAKCAHTCRFCKVPATLIGAANATLAAPEPARVAPVASQHAHTMLGQELAATDTREALEVDEILQSRVVAGTTHYLIRCESAHC